MKIQKATVYGVIFFSVCLPSSLWAVIARPCNHFLIEDRESVHHATLKKEITRIYNHLERSRLGLDGSKCNEKKYTILDKEWDVKLSTYSHAENAKSRVFPSEEFTDQTLTFQYDGHVRHLYLPVIHDFLKHNALERGAMSVLQHVFGVESLDPITWLEPQYYPNRISSKNARNICKDNGQS